MATYRELAETYGAKYKVDPALILAMLSQESQGDPTARSPVGATGLLQLMPATARGLGVKDSTNVEQNIEGGVKYIAQQLSKYKDTATALAAYNAGPARADRFGSKVPFAETRNYIDAIMNKRLPQAQAALAGKQYSIDGVSGIVNVDATPASGVKAVQKGGFATSTPGARSATGTPSGTPSVTPTGSPTGATSPQAAATQALQQVQALLSGGLPTPDYAGSGAATLAALRGNLADVEAALLGGQSQLQGNADTRNAQMQMLLDRSKADPADPLSNRSQNAAAIGELQAGLLNTILAKREQASATLFSNPAAFMENLLLGNPYAKGQSDIEAEIKALRNAGIAVTGEVNDQAQLLEAATLTPDSVIKTGMEAQLRLAELQKDIGIAEAEQPVKVAEAEVQGLLAQAQAANAVADAARTQATLEQDATTQSLRVEAEAVSLQRQILEDTIQQKILTSTNPQEVAQLQGQLQTLQLERQLATEQVGAVAGLGTLQGTTQVANAQRDATLAQSGAATAALDAQTAQKQSANALISANVQTGDLQFAQANQAAAQALALQQQKVAGLQAQVAEGDTQAALELAPAKRQLEAMEAGLRQKELVQKAATIDASGRVASKELAEAEAGQDARAVARSKTQLGFNKAGGAGTVNIAQLSEEVQAGLAQVADGKPAGRNAYESAALLSGAGLVQSNAQYPGLRQAANVVTQLSAQLAGDTKAAALLSVDNEKLGIALQAQTLVGKDATSFGLRSNPSNIYGLPEHNAFAAWAAQTGKANGAAATIFNLPVETEFGKASTLGDMLGKLDDAGVKPADAAAAIAAYASLAVEYNNANTGYELLGIDKSKVDDFNMKDDKGRTINLTSSSDIVFLTNKRNYQKILDTIPFVTFDK